MRPDVMSERVQRRVMPLHRSVEQLNPARDMVERQRAGDELARSADQLQTLAQLLLEAREDERRRLAQELHDRVGQNLTALDLNLNVIRGALPSDISSQVG